MIYDFIDYRAYLAFWFKEKKTAKKSYSYRLFSRKMNQKSPSYLKDIIDRRRNITMSQFDLLCTTLGLRQREKNYLRHLIVFDQSKNPLEKKRAFELIAAARRVTGARLIEGESYRYLSTWYCPAIRELANLPDFQPEASWIVERIRPKITKKQANEALEILQELNMLTITEGGGFSLHDGTLTTPPEVMGLAVHNYHQEMLRLAAESIAGFDPQDRHLLGVTVTANEHLLPTIKQELNDFAARICDLCDAEQTDKDRVLQINLHFYPLSSPPSENS